MNDYDVIVLMVISNSSGGEPVRDATVADAELPQTTFWESAAV
jgi:hypothetical protein